METGKGCLDSIQNIDKERTHIAQIDKLALDFLYAERSQLEVSLCFVVELEKNKRLDRMSFPREGTNRLPNEMNTYFSCASVKEKRMEYTRNRIGNLSDIEIL